MDFGGVQLVLIEIVGPLLLLLVMISLVMRVRSRGKKSSPERTEQATHDLYQDEDRRDEGQR